MFSRSTTEREETDLQCESVGSVVDCKKKDTGYPKEQHDPQLASLAQALKIIVRLILLRSCLLPSLVDNKQITEFKVDTRMNDELFKQIFRASAAVKKKKGGKKKKK